MFVDAIAVEDIGGWRYFGALPLADAAARVARIGLPVLTGSTIGAPPHGQDRRGVKRGAKQGLPGAGRVAC